MEESTTTELKIECPHCGQHILVDDSYSGETTNCPTCNGQILIPSFVPPPLPKSAFVDSRVSDNTYTTTNHFTIVELQQGTSEWLKWRHNGIGASDAATIMGENRFKSISALLREKRGMARNSFQNSAMARGTALEPKAREVYIATSGRVVRPVCLQSTQYDWLRASLDGLSINNDAVVEIKCGQSAYRIASQTRAIPSYYYGQVQHILAVTGLNSLDFWCYWPNCTPILIPVPRNDVYIEQLLNKELDFWSLIQ